MDTQCSNQVITAEYDEWDETDDGEMDTDATFDDETGPLGTQEEGADLKVYIESLPEDYAEARQRILDDITPLVRSLTPDMQEYYVKMIAGRVKMKRQTITDLVLSPEHGNIDDRENDEAKKKDPLTPEIVEIAKELSEDPLLIKRRIDAVNRSGVVGERKTIAMYFASLDSRLLLGSSESPDVISVKNSGHFGAGKSYSLTKCLQLYPEDAYHLITNGSAKSMFYLQGGLKHKALVVTEGFEFQAGNGKDSELAYSIRSLISEGRLSYMVVVSDEKGELRTVQRKLEGPTSFITTTVLESLESQLEDRLFTIHPDDSSTQTKEIIRFTALQRAGLYPGLDRNETRAWKAFHKQLRPVTVVIPFAERIANHLIRADRVPMPTRRAFKRVLAIIQTIACAYQHQRRVDDQGRIVAEVSDYWMALQIVNEAFHENMGLESQASDRRIEDIGKKGPTRMNELAKHWGISPSAVSSWAKSRVESGILAWCDERGNILRGDELQRAKHSGLACLRTSDEHCATKRLGLPTPFELTGLPAWDEGGELLARFNLELDPGRVEDPDPYRGDEKVLDSDLDTSTTPEPVAPIEIITPRKVGNEELRRILRESRNKETRSTNPEEVARLAKELFDEVGSLEIFPSGVGEGVQAGC